MKKRIIVGITIIACAAVWPWSAEVRNLPAESVKTVVTAESEARSEEIQQNLFFADAPTPVVEAVVESEPPKTEITAEKEAKTVPPPDAKLNAVAKSSSASSEPKSSNKKVVDGKPYIYIPGFGWIEDYSDEGGGTFAADMYKNGNKIGVMGGGTMVGNPGDEFTGNKVGIMGGGTTVLVSESSIKK